MASTFKKKQKKHLIAAIVCCVLVAAMLVASLVIALVHRASLYQDFSDKGFAKAIADSLGLSSQYNLEQSDLDQFEGLVYYCNVGVDTKNNYASYAYPVVMLCDKTYTDVLIEESNPDHDHDEHASDDTDYSSNYKVVPYVLTDPADLNMFRNLRLLRAYDVTELNQMASSCQTTQIYSMYGLGTSPVSFDTVLNATRLSKLTDLSQISSLTKLEQLSLCYTGITSLKGLENFPNLNKLDVTYTAVTDISALSAVPGLTYLGLSSLNETVETKDDTSSEESSETSSETSSEASDDQEEDKKEEEKEPTFNETGLQTSQLSALSGLTELVYLDITNNNITDLSALKGLTKVKFLSVAKNPLTDLNGAEGMKDMKILYAANCKLADVKALGGFGKLESVYLSGNKLASLEGLSSAVKVTTLDASDNKLADASAVSGMTELATLTLNKNELTAVPDLSKLTKVTSINLSENKLTDASGLKEFDPTGHEKEKDDKGEEKAVSITLNLSKNELTELTLKASLLTSLDVSENKLGKDVTGEALHLDGCKALTTVTLNKNSTLKTLGGIEKLTELTTLNATGTAIVSLPELKGLKKLATVNLSENKLLVDINGLKDTEALATLTLTECSALTDISAVPSMKKLATLNLSKCVALTDDSVVAAFGTPKDGDTEAKLLLEKDSKLTLTLTGCEKITDFKIFDAYGNMKVTKDTTK